jgi:2',3'-cyclic-nucleotide 2'-phosphodiesterase (5'-nucleotidase family)
MKVGVGHNERVTLKILHTNDFHGKMTPEIAERIAALKSETNALYFDSGDGIKAGNLALPLRPEKVWPLLAQAGCDASVPGNRESHVLESGLSAKFAGAAHPIVCANWYRKSGERVFPSHLVLDHKGLKIGVLGVMVPIVTPIMATVAASAFVWTFPLKEASAIARELRSSVDLVMALTHIGEQNDVRLAEECPEIDIILGGHTHSILDRPKLVGSTAICQGGSHGRFLGVYEWSSETRALSGRLVSLRESLGEALEASR